MLSPFNNTWAPLGLLIVSVWASFGDAHRQSSSYVNDSICHDPEKNSSATVVDTTTIFSSTVVPVTHYVDVTSSHYVDVTVPHYVNVTISSTETEIVSTCITESTTTTLHYTVSITETETDSATITNTQTTTATVPATITTYTTQTIFSTTYDPCPKTCSLSVGTVNLFFWPTSRPYTYPSRYVDTALAYTFTSPSVYMLIPTAQGTNSLGPMGPSTSKWILPLDLEEVSTIVDGSITRQLTLADLGTDCPQSAEPTAIATMVDPRCDPILAAPKQVSSWASPCNACGRFGLFDPPYAVPTITGGLIPTTSPTPVPTVTVPPPTTTPPVVGTLLVVYYSDGKPVATATIPTTGVSGTLTSSVVVSPTATSAESSPPPPTTTPSTAPQTVSSPAQPETPSSTPSTAPSATISSPVRSSTPSSTPSTLPTTSPTPVVTASATRVTGGLAWLISGTFIVIFLM